MHVTVEGLPWEKAEPNTLTEKARSEVATLLVNQVMGVMKHLRECHPEHKHPQGTNFTTEGDTAIFVVHDGKTIRVLDCKILREVNVDVG